MVAMPSMRVLVFGALCTVAVSAKPCELPDGWDLVGNPEQCHRILFKCPDDMEIFKDHECGCGCKRTQLCEVPDGWVLKGTPEQCRLLRFTCAEGTERFGGHKCGCGCKGPQSECPRGYTHSGDGCVTAEGLCPHPQIDIVFVGGAPVRDPVTGEVRASRSVRCGTWGDCTRGLRSLDHASCTTFGA